MQKNGNHSKQSFRPQCNQIRTQDSETNSEPYNFMETKQLALECRLDNNEMKAEIKSVFRNQQEQRHNVPESLGHI